MVYACVMETTTFKTVTVSGRGMRALSAKVADLNKRAVKLGLAEINVDVTKEVEFVPCYTKGFGVSETLYTVAISGVEPCVNGWRFVGKIEFSELGNIVKTVGDQEVDSRYRTIGPVCEHCNSVRRRKDTFILRKDGEDKVVGRNCLADFIRDGDAGTLGAFAEIADRIHEFGGESDYDDDEYNGGGCGGGPVVKTLAYLTMTSCIIRKFGWTSKTAARDSEFKVATTEYLSRCYFGRKTADFIEAHELYPTDKDLLRAAAALEWARGKVGDRSEYLHNIGTMAGSEWLVWKYDGYVASIIAAYAKDQDQEIERRKAKAERTFIGEVGKRIRKVTGTVVRLRFTEGYYGSKTIVTIEVPVGDKRAVLTWFASGDKDGDLTEGETITFDATVKKHESDPKYGDSTIVTRLTVLEAV